MRYEQVFKGIDYRELLKYFNEPSLHYNEESEKFRWLWTLIASVNAQPDFDSLNKEGYGYYKNILSKINVKPFLKEIKENTDLFIPRPEYTPALKNVNTIYLRGADCPEDKLDMILHCQKTKDLPMAEKFPVTMKFINEFAEKYAQGSVEKVIINELKPKQPIYPHYDNGAYYCIRDRYHIVVKSSSGSKMTFKNKNVIWREGEVWWFNHIVFHNNANLGKEGRIHIIFDVLPHRNKPIAEEFTKMLGV